MELVKVIAILILLPAYYIYLSWTLWIIAKKTFTGERWMAWIPLINIGLMTKIAGISRWSVFYLFIPVMNFWLIAMLYTGMAEARGKSQAFAILVFIPILGPLVVHTWLAFCDSERCMELLQARSIFPYRERE